MVSWNEYFIQISIMSFIAHVLTWFLGHTCSTEAKTSPPPQRVHSLSSSPEGFL